MSAWYVKRLWHPWQIANNEVEQAATIVNDGPRKLNL
jgi:hypothetical protein